MPGKAEKLLIWAKRQAIGRMDLSWGARECWRILDGFPKDKCYPSHAYIALKLGKSVSSARRYISELEEKGYITVAERFDSHAERDRGQTSNRYQILAQQDLMACAHQIIQEYEAKHRRQS